MTAALIIKFLYPHIKIFYHENEITKLDFCKWYSLRLWVQKITIKYAKHCIWVSAPDVKRADYFSKASGIKDVKVIRNFALHNVMSFVEKYPLCEDLRKDGYVISVYTGTIGKGNSIYIKSLIEFIRTSVFKFAIFMTGIIADREIENFLKYEKNNIGLSKIIHLGYLPKNDIYALLNSADFAFELHELSLSAKMNAGSSVKAGEYMAFGLPLIYPSFWNYEAYYNKIGLSYSNSKELIESVSEMVKNKDFRRKLTNNARDIFKNGLYFENEFKPLKETIELYMKSDNIFHDQRPRFKKYNTN